MGLLEFLALPGQERTQRRDAFFGGLLNHFLGPTGIDQRIGALDMLNPVSDVGRAMQSSEAMMQPNITPMERVGHAGAMLTDVASVAAPAVATRIAGGDAAMGLMDSLMSWGGPTREGLDDAARRFAADESGALRLWHGSPHDFDRFSMDKIGTGEGAQAYGHGLYFAESDEVATAYRTGLAGMEAKGADFSQYGMSEAEAKRIAKNWLDYQKVNPNELVLFADDSPSGRIIQDIVDGKITEGPGGRLYEVNVNANPEDFLDWDAPLSAQPEKVREAFGRVAQNFEDLGDTSLLSVNPNAPQFDGDAYPAWYFKGSRARPGLENELRAEGIPGIRYLDAGSRGAGDGSRNYVVFDENLISIINKYGIAGAAAMLGVSASELQASMPLGQYEPSGQDEIKQYLGLLQ